ncbi:unnamed protein product [Parajaminaea phylloscopi]
MALDSALFTLHFVPRQSAPSIIDLFTTAPIASSSQQPPAYTLSRAVRSPLYSTTLLDGLTHVELASISAASTAEKVKDLQLLNPEFVGQVIRRGNAFKPSWLLQWQNEVLLVTREGSLGTSAPAFDVEIIRKPDPPIKVAMYRPESKKTSAFLQIFDYNIDRVENITDKKGLEQSLILAVASCLDIDFDERHKDAQNNIFLPIKDVSKDPSRHSHPVMPPPEHLDANEVYLTPLVEPAHVVQHCIDLLRTDARSSSASSGTSGGTRGHGLELITLQAHGDEMAKRALGVAERVKVGFYRLLPEEKGTLSDGIVPEELFMYVRPIDTTPPSQRTHQEQEGSVGEQSSAGSVASGPTMRPRIRLNAPSASPSTSGSTSPSPHTFGSIHARSEEGSSPALSGIKIYLSKCKLEELEAEQARGARMREERQSRHLAELLQREQALSSQLTAPTLGAPAREPTTAAKSETSETSRLDRFLSRLHVHGTARSSSPSSPKVISQETQQPQTRVRG